MKMKILAAAIIASVQLAGCSSSSNPTPTNVIDIVNVKKVLETNADIALAAYTDSVDTAEKLQTALATFKETPTQANLDAAKKAWLVSREPYGQTEVYRFRLSPIDSTDYSSEDGPEGDINAWPLGESLIDYVVEGTDFGADQTDVLHHGNEDLDYPTENIINSSIAINKALISNTATADDEHDVIAGYHAIEFMLWGQDLNADGSGDTETAGNGQRESATYDATRATGGHRPLTDFTTADNADRRHTYMEVVAAKLVSDLKAVRGGWEVGASYRTAFTAAADETEAKQKLAEILTGMGTLAEGELAGERMQIAFASNSQEDEHSCFSDNTHRDIVLNAMGILNSYNGEYLGYDSNDDGVPDVTTNAVDGYGLDDYLAAVNLTAEAADLSAKLATTKDNYMAIDALARAGTPVDVQILEATATEPMALTIKSLNAESSSIANLATALGITGDVVDPDGSDCDTSNPTEEC